MSIWLNSDPRDLLAVAQRHADELRAEAAAERAVAAGGPSTRRSLATQLRRLADRIDPAPNGGAALGNPS